MMKASLWKRTVAGSAAASLALTLFSCSTAKDIIHWTKLKVAPVPQSDPLRLHGFFSGVRPPSGNPDAHYLLGAYYQKRGDYWKAVEEFRKVVLIDPHHVKAYEAMGISYDLLGDYQSATLSYKRALAVMPNLDSVHNNLGYSFLLQGKIGEAIKSLETAVALNSDEKRYRNNLGLAYAEEGLFELAFLEFKKAEGEAKAHETLGRICLKEGLNEEAARHLKRDFASNPSLTALEPADSASKPKAEVLTLTEKVAVSDSKPEPRRPETTESGSAAVYEEIKETILSSKFVVPTAHDTETGGQSTKHADHAVSKEEKYSPPAETAKIDQAQRSGRAGIEVSNGNGVTGMAKRVGDYLKQKGFNVIRLTNASDFKNAVSRIYYRQGFAGEAREVAEQMIVPVPRIEEKKNLDRPDLQVKIVIGRDLIAHSEGPGKKNNEISVRQTRKLSWLSKAQISSGSADY